MRDDKLDQEHRVRVTVVRNILSALKNKDYSLSPDFIEAIAEHELMIIKFMENENLCLYCMRHNKVEGDVYCRCSACIVNGVVTSFPFRVSSR